ncbi:MAG: hypothetical protein HYU68_09615, partial [Bacteroidetes bacterium]|nr:hypothetical protein [Bacteroidota bacterium]
MVKQNTYHNLFKSLLPIIIGMVLSVSFNYTSAQSYNFQFFNVQEGLPQSTVNTIFQDSRGFLWIGTAGGGICKFDGENFTPYFSKNGIAGDIVTDITEDKNQNIWFTASWGGVTKFDGRKFTVFNKDKTNSLVDGNNLIFCDAKGRIWIAENNNVKIYKNGVFNDIHQSLQQKIKGAVTKIIEDSKNNLWITTAAGIIFINETDTLEITT